jgi:hypothetical protein
MENHEHKKPLVPDLIVGSKSVDDNQLTCQFSGKRIWVNYNDLTVLPHWNHG